MTTRSTCRPCERRPAYNAISSGVFESADFDDREAQNVPLVVHFLHHLIVRRAALTELTIEVVDDGEAVLELGAEIGRVDGGVYVLGAGRFKLLFPTSQQWEQWVCQRS